MTESEIWYCQVKRQKKENKAGWKQFSDNSRPDSNALYQEHRFWNITNPYEVLKGAKPKVKEVGPYTYRANQRRVNTTFWTDRDGLRQVKFKMYRYFTFDPSRSFEGADPVNDNITSANVIFAAAVLAQTDMAYAIYTDPKYTDYSRLFTTKRVEWWLFGGHSSDIGFMIFPGFNTNDTLENVEKTDYCSQYTGTDHLFLTGMLTKWKGFTSIKSLDKPPPLEGDWVNPWGSPEANKLHGTSGDAFAPLNSFGKGDTVPAYVDDLYQEIPLSNINDEVMTIKGVDLIAFRITAENMANSTTNPHNKPYYMDGPNGFFNLSAPRLAPLMVSMPHLLYVDEEVQKKVEGQQPDEKKHATWLGVEPWTGMTLAAQKTWQINTPIGPLNISDGNDPPTYVSWFPKVTPGTYLPMAWMKYGGVMNDDIASTIKDQVYVGVTAKSLMKWLGFGLGLLLLVLGLVLLLSAMKELRREHIGKSRVLSSQGSHRHRGYRRVDASEG